MSCAIGCWLIHLEMGADLSSMMVGTVVDCFVEVGWTVATKEVVVDVGGDCAQLVVEDLL